jgi:hypothetical protein
MLLSIGKSISLAILHSLRIQPSLAYMVFVSTVLTVVSRVLGSKV